LLLRREIARVIRTHRPDLVITQSPERNWERMRASHPDHMASGEATMRASIPTRAIPRLSRTPARGLSPHSVPVVWLSGSQATMVVDITKRFKYKHAALKRHVSQVGDHKALKKMLKGWARAVAKDAGLDKGVSPKVSRSSSPVNAMPAVLVCRYDSAPVTQRTRIGQRTSRRDSARSSSA